MEAFCVGLIFSRDEFRYQSYVRQYVEVLLRLQKEIAIFSPNWVDIHHELSVKYKDHAKRIHCFPIEETHSESISLSYGESIWRYLSLSRRLKQAEKSMGLKIDLVFFAPLDDWIRPKFGKKIFSWCFPFKFSGLLMNMTPYELGGLKLNIDPKYGEPDYLLSSDNCKGVCTLDRFRSEALKSRVYKKVVVLPDVSDLALPEKSKPLAKNLKKMARGRMIVGALLFEGENPDYFLELVSIAPSDLYFFVFSGKFTSDSLKEESKARISHLLSSGRKNFLFIPGEQDDEAGLNELVKTMDVMYLNDGDYQLSNPMLTKAAYFQKPVLGSQKDMIGRLVSTFKTGISVNGDIYDSLNALSALRLQMPFETGFDSGKFKNYAQLQSREALTEAWEMILLF